MKLTVVDRSELHRMGYKKTKMQALFEEFIAMDTPVVRVDHHDYKNATTCQACLSSAEKRWTKNVAVMSRGNSVYLVRTDMED